MSDTWTIGELAERAADALRGHSAPLNGRVREVPSERLIRWYTTIGLVDPPLTRRGRIARYGRRHLLQLVAIKRLQAQGMSIADIQVALAGATDATLEATATGTHHTDTPLVPDARLADTTPGQLTDTVPGRLADAASRELADVAPGASPPVDGDVPLANGPGSGTTYPPHSPSPPHQPGPPHPPGAPAQLPRPGPGNPAGRARVEPPARTGRFWADRPVQGTGRPARRSDRPSQGTDRPAWRSDRPAQGAGHPARADRSVREADPSTWVEDPGSAVVHGVRLAPGVVLVLDGAGRALDDEDVQAVRAAAASLLAVLEERGLR
jgi:DNA-binding transcriptional MerR regulator